LEFAGCSQWIAKTKVLEDEQIAVDAVQWLMKELRKRRIVVAQD
jgi:hypothetical protein